jgi:hypothetical protein
MPGGAGLSCGSDWLSRPRGGLLAPTRNGVTPGGDGNVNVPERFQAKWKPVRVKKTRQIKNLEPRFDSIETEKALAVC